MEEAGGWNAIFWNCHDQPRALSRFGDPIHYPKESAKMLAAVLFTRRGTPYMLYGDAIGMTNLNTQRISDYVDIESLNTAELLKKQGLNEAQILEILQAKSWDNGRSPMQWTNKANGGFSTTKPWLMVNDNLETVNVEDVSKDPDSIYAYYKKLIELKKNNPVLQHGSTTPLLVEDENLYAFARTLDGQEILCIHNFYGKKAPLHLDLHGYERLLSNYPDYQEDLTALRPYESLILQKR